AVLLHRRGPSAERRSAGAGVDGVRRERGGAGDRARAEPGSRALSERSPAALRYALTGCRDVSTGRSMSPTPPRSRDRSVRALLTIQSGYFLITGLWPLLHYRSF